jgi:uncharacterized protein (UPF0335 family)
MSGSGDVAGNQLRTIVERIENIEEEIKELTEAKKEVYLEAKANGVDVKILREVIRVRKQDQKERDEQETLVEVYLGRILCGKGCLTEVAGRWPPSGSRRPHYIDVLGS